MTFAPTTQALLKTLNEKRGLKYPAVGYTYFADVRGDGVFSPRVYEVTTPSGGVNLSPLNNADPRKRCAAIRAAIAATP